MTKDWTGVPELARLTPGIHAALALVWKKRTDQEHAYGPTHPDFFIDDIDGGPAEGTVRFGLDGADYEIDLSTEHTEELHKVLAAYVTHARKARPGPARFPGPSAR